MAALAVIRGFFSFPPPRRCGRRLGLLADTHDELARTAAAVPLLRAEGAERMNLALPGLALVKQLYEAVRAQGPGRQGTQARLLALEHPSNRKR